MSITGSVDHRDASSFVKGKLKYLVLRAANRTPFEVTAQQVKMDLILNKYYAALPASTANANTHT